MFVLGVDPGLSRCGYGVLEPLSGGKVRAVAAGVITTPAAAPLPERLGELQREIRALLTQAPPAVVAVERVYFQANVRTAMSVGQASGVVMAEAINAGCEVAQYGPNEVKQAVAGWGGAGKDEIERMVQRLLGIDHPLRPVDAADAVALALCHLAHEPALRRLAAR